jgi:hypothetical protein
VLLGFTEADVPRQAGKDFRRADAYEVMPSMRSGGRTHTKEPSWTPPQVSNRHLAAAL